MERLASLFVIVCIATIGASTTVVLNRWIAVELQTSIAVGAAISSTILLFFLILSRERRLMRLRVTDLTHICHQAIDDSQNLERRLRAVENGGDGTSRLDDLIEEVGILSALFKQLAESASDMEIRMIAVEKAVFSDPPKVASDNPIAATREIDEEPVLQIDNQAAIVGLRDKAIKDAVLADKIQLQLQSVFSLPQRRAVFYEMLSYAKLENGDLASSDEFLSTNNAYDYVFHFDEYQISKAVQLLEKLTARNQQLKFFVNISALSLSDPTFYSNLLTTIEANAHLAGHLYFEFTQDAVRNFGPIEYESMATLQDAGFNFSMDQVHNLKVDLGELGDRGFRFFKIASARLFFQANQTSFDIHPADIGDLLQRHDITLIADQLASENEISNLSDLGIKFGQGDALGRPKLIRTDIFANGLTASGTINEGAASAAQ